MLDQNLVPTDFPRSLEERLTTGRAGSASRWSGVACQNTGTCRFPKRPERAPDGEGRLGALLVGPEWLEKNLVS